MRHNVTAGTTIFWKFFVPIFWTSVMTTLTMGLIFTDINPMSLPKNAFIILALVTLALGIFLFWFFLFRLKKVEMDSDFIYVTNYFKSFKYPYHNIEKVTERDFTLFKVVTFRFKKKGNFGKQIYFLANHRALNEFLANHPQVAQDLFPKSD